MGNQPSGETHFHSTGPFTINGVRYNEISIDKDRIVAKAHMARVEIMVEDIGSVSMIQSRRFGNIPLITAIPLFAITVVILAMGPPPGGSSNPLYLPLNILLLACPVGAICLIAFWLSQLGQVLVLYTKSTQYEIRGEDTALTELWRVVTEVQRGVSGKTRVGTESDVPLRSITVDASDKRFCSYCGAEKQLSGARFCPNCGNPSD